MNAVVIIPAYDPDETLRKIVDRVWNLENQIVVVDDGSDSSIAELFDRLSNKAVVLHHAFNQGKGMAIKTALRYIKENMWDCDAIGVMDADGQHLPEDMERLLMKVDRRKKNLILGVREVGKNMPLKSRLGNQITRTVFHVLSGVRVSDTQTGLRAFSPKMLEELLKIEGKRYEYETNVLFACARAEIPIEEVSVRTIYHDEGNSCSHFHAVMDSFRIYRDIIRFSLSSFSSFLLDYILFCILTVVFPVGAAGMLMANVMARIVSGAYNYFVNARLVFKHGETAQTRVQYLLLAVAILFMNSILLQFYSMICGIPVFGAKILTELTLFIFSFTVQRKLIFKGAATKKGLIHA